MGRQFHLGIETPLGGVVKSTAYQSQPPFSAFDSTNFWPIDARTDRAQLATRPGRSPLTRPGSGLSCQMLIPINGADSGKPYQSFVAGFDSDVYYWNGTGFTAATGAQASSVDTGRAVYGSPFLQQVFICKASSKPLVFDYNAGTVTTLVESAGTAPSDTRMAAAWQGALWVAGQLATPHILYSSRVGNAADWDSSVAANDRGGAFATTGENAGKLTGPITALMPQTFDTMIVSTFSGLIAMRAHPRQGGVFQPIGETTYAMGQGAWCIIPGDIIFMLTPMGMMMLEPHANATPTQVSRNKIPNELLGLEYNYENPVVSMAYTKRFNGIYIFVRGEQEQAWFYYLPNGSFHRMAVTGYPFVVMDFPPFATNNTCSVLQGGYDSLDFFDAFSEESFESSIVIGPVKLSDTSLNKSIIHQARVILGRDTPDTGETSTLKIATGNDGQDAVARLLQELHQYEGSLVTASNNNGVVYPKVAGHAAVFGIGQTSGDLVIEGIDLLCETAGVNRMNRAPQIPVEDGASDFSEGGDAFDEDLWQGKSCSIPNAAPNSTLTDFTHWIDLSALPDSWWDVVASDGRDIRATDEDGDQIPLDLIYFDSSLKTGFCTVKMTQTIPPRGVCLWVGNPDAGPLAPDDDFGQYAAYDSSTIQFIPSGGARDGGEEDRTANENHITLANQVDATCLDVGPIGVQATDYTHIDATNNYGRATAAVPSTYPVTLVVVAKDPDSTTLPCYGLRDQSGPTAANLEITANRTATHQRCDAGSTDTAAGASEAQSTTAVNSANFRHFAATITGAAARAAFLDGGNKGTNTGSVTIASGVLDEIIIGKGARSGLSASSTTAELCLAQVHDTVRSDDWIAYQASMLGDFWDDWDEFDEVNPPEPDPDPDPGACPLGTVAVSETGSWSGYAEATPDAPTATQVDFTHFIDLAAMPASWWSAVSSTGVDIRATDENNQFIPLDLIEFDKTAETGFCTVKLTQNSTQARPIRLWVGNGSAVTVPACAAYGQYRAYDDDWQAFYPSGAGDDRTQWLRHLVASSGDLDEAGIAGPIGNTATRYNQTTLGYGQHSVTSADQTDLDPQSIMIVSVSRVNSPRLYRGSAHVTLRKSLGNYASVILGHEADTYPGRFYVFNTANAFNGAYQDIAQSVGSWHHQVGFNLGSTLRQLWVDGDGDQEEAGSAMLPGPVDQIVVGARIGSTNINSWAFQGDLSLIQIHSSPRTLTNAWAAYQAAMLDQSTFWNGWNWTAEVSSLPQ